MNLRSGDRRTRAIFAILLAIVLVSLGPGVRQTSLGSAADHGLAGVAAERVEFASLPLGKQTNDGRREVVEAEDKKASHATGVLGQAPLEELTFASLGIEVVGGFAVRGRRSIAAVSARGPPVG